MDEQGMIATLREMGAVFGNDHFVLTSGKHSDGYVNAGKVSTDPHQLSLVGEYIAQHFLNHNLEAIVCPAEAAIPLVQWITYHYNQLRDEAASPRAIALYASKVGKDDFIFKRGYGEDIRGKRCLVVDDLGTSGESVKKVVYLARQHGGEVVAVAYICNRGGVTAEMVDAPELFVACNLAIEAWPEEDCPPCKAGVPINTEYGHGKEYLRKKAGEA